MKPMLLINFKAYEPEIGEKALHIAKLAEKVARQEGVRIVVSPQHSDIARLAKEVSVDVYAQHVDVIEPGSHTGWVLPLGVKASGAKGTLINHSEHRIPKDMVKKTVDLCKKVGLVTVCCAASAKEAKEIAHFSPDFIAIELPELIGGDISVSTAEPGIISDTVKAVKGVDKKVEVLCGAGVHCGEDVKKGIELGTKGALAASVIIKTGNPEKAIRGMAKGLKG
jgi:triosephosphate isomerase